MEVSQEYLNQVVIEQYKIHVGAVTNELVGERAKAEVLGRMLASMTEDAEKSAKEIAKLQQEIKNKQNMISDLAAELEPFRGPVIIAEVDHAPYAEIVNAEDAEIRTDDYKNNEGSPLGC